MNDNKSGAAGGGISFASLLTLAFIILKLCNVINWSWWWVLAPLWVLIGIVTSGIVIYCIKYKEFKDELEA